MYPKRKVSEIFNLLGEEVIEQAWRDFKVERATTGNEKAAFMHQLRQAIRKEASAQRDKSITKAA